MAKSRRSCTEHSPWATPHAEIQDVQTMGFSADGSLLYEGGSSSRVYIWKM